jgi:hypothetical protein
VVTERQPVPVHCRDYLSEPGASGSLNHPVHLGKLPLSVAPFARPDHD